MFLIPPPSYLMHEMLEDTLQAHLPVFRILSMLSLVNAVACYVGSDFQRSFLAQISLSWVFSSLPDILHPSNYTTVYFATELKPRLAGLTQVHENSTNNLACKISL